MLNQWNPLALLSLAHRSTNNSLQPSLSSSLSTQQHNGLEESSSQWTEDARNNSRVAVASNDYCTGLFVLRGLLLSK